MSKGGRYAKPAAASGFTDPTSIAGLVAWYDAANAGSITASGGNVSQWNDLSGNAYHLTQGSGALQPDTGTRTINSLNTLDFYGDFDRDALASTGLDGASLTAATLFVVGAIDVDPPASDATGGHPVYQVAGGVDLFPYSGDSTIYDGFGTTARKTTVNPTPALTSPYLYTVLSSSGNWTSRLNGTQIFTTGTNTFAWNATTIGGAGSGSNWNYDGRIAEIVIYNSALGSTDRGNVESYLTTKWGVV